MMSSDWSDREIEATVEAYVWMLSQEALGAKYSKAAVNALLRKNVLSLRSKSSVEYRMQNISAVLEGLNLPRIVGYLPAKNVGAKVSNEIKKTLLALGQISVESELSSNGSRTQSVGLDRSFRVALSKLPIGIRNPQETFRQSKVYLRSPLVRSWVLSNASGRCEACKEKSPFSLVGGLPYLEVHHMRSLADAGPDVVANAVALCPNCHRRCHLSADRDSFNQKLFDSILRLERTVSTTPA